VQKEVDLTEGLARLGHHGGNVGVLRHIQGNQKLGLLFLVGQDGHAMAVALPRVVRPVRQMGEAALGPLRHGELGNRPSDRMVVRHPQDQPLFPVEQLHRESPAIR
jgi:hypothetical protein